jgi:deoxyribodipyrimidine photo-lyase
MKKERVHLLNDKEINPNGKRIIYWMSRDQRVRDNWALLYAQQLALEQQIPLIVLFVLTEKFSGATLRQYDFMLRGLQEVERDLRELNIGFEFLKGEIVDIVSDYVIKSNASALVCDFSPLRIGRKWREGAAKKIGVSMFEVDAHNIVPVRIASVKQEFGAYTLRPKINKLLPTYLEHFQEIKKHPFGEISNTKVDWNREIAELAVDKSVNPVDWITPGESAAYEQLEKFISERLDNYDKDRNDPNTKGQSDLSPYLHFGQISAQRIAFEVEKYKMTGGNVTSADAFLEELIVRRELSDNFCLYNHHYDSVNGFPEWAKKTHEEHKNDTREHLYSKKEFEESRTNDDAWNACQTEMVNRGKMHGYMRMYWAKKILEWTESAEKAMDIAIYLNDKYELDGRDPNGYVGIAWSIGGVHDRAWFERSVFGKIRYMNSNGLKKKFDLSKYINYINSLV